MSQMLTCGPVVTPGTPQKMLSATSPSLAAISGVLSGSIAPRGNFVSLQAHPGNTAGKSIFVGTSGAMSVSAKTGLGLAVTTGAQPVQIFAQDSGLIDLGEFWIDTDSANANTEKLLVTVGP